MARVTLLVASILLVGSCSEGSKDAPDRASAEVPDPCELVGAAQLSELAGLASGAGSLKALAPLQRKVCVYEGGLSLAIEHGDAYDSTVEQYGEAAPIPLQSVDSVGSDAVWQDLGGGAGQLLVSAGSWMVAVTVGSGGSEAASRVAAAMVSAL